MLKTVFAQVISLSLALNCYPAEQRKTADDLRRRVKLFHTSFFSGKPDQMWSMLSRRLRQQNDNDKRQYVSSLPKGKFIGVHHVDIEIEEIQTEGIRARVVLKITIWTDAEKKLAFERNQDLWVFERGKWFFDGEKTLDEKLFDKDEKVPDPWVLEKGQWVFEDHHMTESEVC